MKQAQITEWNTTPKVITVPTPQPSDGLVQIKVLATGLHGLVRLRTTGNHYSAQGLPHIPGIDGVGTTVPDGELVYFMSVTPRGGSFSEYIQVPRASLTPLPAHADPVQVAGLMNPVMASWMALATRVQKSVLPKDFTVAIVGVTSLSGAAAVSVARTFGAGRVIGVGRSAAKMNALGLDLDGTVEIAEDASKTEFSEAALQADVILDFLFGPPMQAYLEALKPGKTVQYVQVGTMAGRTIEFLGDLLRGKDITMRGTGPGSWKMPEFVAQAPLMAGAIAEGHVKKHPFKEVKMEDIATVWEEGRERMVVLP